MTFLDLLSYRHITPYQVCKTSNIPKTTMHDIASGKSDLLNCNGKTLLELSKALKVTIEELLNLEKEERNDILPIFLVESINNLRTAIRKESTYIDCCYDELASSINVAEVDHWIDKETADRLRRRYLYD